MAPKVACFVAEFKNPGKKKFAPFLGLLFVLRLFCFSSISS
jgi:hypothetical protein